MEEKEIWRVSKNEGRKRIGSKKTIIIQSGDVDGDASSDKRWKSITWSYLTKRNGNRQHRITNQKKLNWSQALKEEVINTRWY